MEYSVRDLVRILLKKWYIIILVMALISAASVFLSQRSYASAVENYEELTSEIVVIPIKTGTLQQCYQLTFQLNPDLQDELNQHLAKNLVRGIQDNTEIAYFEDLILSKQQQSFVALATDPDLIAEVQVEVDTLSYEEPPAVDDNNVVTFSSQPLSVQDHVTATAADEGILSLVIVGLDEPVAEQLASIYLSHMTARLNSLAAIVGKVHQTSASFTADPVRHTKLAQVAQTVMKEPVAPPNLIKTVGTAAAYSFVLSCFGVLLFTFIRDSKKSRKD